MKKTITVEELKQILAQKEPVHLLDVRTPAEHQQFNIGGQLIPIQELALRLHEIHTDTRIVVYCRSGNRSQTAVDLLEDAGIENAQNLIGGMMAWQNSI